MGVQFDRMLEPFSGPFEKVTDWNVTPPPGRVNTLSRRGGYALPRFANDAVRAVNRMLAAGTKVGMAEDTFIFVTASPAPLQRIATELGLNFQRIGPTIDPPALRAPRIGLWDQYGGSIESGWTRWILEQFEFPFSRVYAPELDAGNLNAKYDAIVFASGAIPPVADSSGRSGRRAGAGPDPSDIPAEYRSQLGRVTAERTIPQLRAFVENGGTIIALSDSAMHLAEHFGLPVENHLVENGAPLPRAKFFVPGSVLTARVDTRQPLAAGMPDHADFFFDNNPVFRPRPGAARAGVRTIAMFDTATPLHSGWAWGQKYLEGGAIALDVAVGKGHVVLYGAEILQRAQPHGTFKLLFNALYLSVTSRQ
jgi:hypothetical protein